MSQYTIASDYDVRMAKRKVESSYCTAPYRFTMVIMVVQRGRVQADHNATSNERDVLLVVMQEAVEAKRSCRRSVGGCG